MDSKNFALKQCSNHNEVCSSIAVLKNRVDGLEGFKNTAMAKLDEMNRINDKITRIEVLMEREFKLIQEKFTTARATKNTFISNFVYPLSLAVLAGGFGYLLSIVVGK